MPRPANPPLIGGRPVTDLPVGNGRDQIEQIERTARAAAQEALADLGSSPAVSEARDAATNRPGLERLGQSFPQTIGDAAGSFLHGRSPSPAAANGAPAANGAVSPGSPGAPEGRAAGAVSPDPAPDGSPLGQTASAAGDAEGRLGSLLEALEERLLLETERRGGRWTGVF